MLRATAEEAMTQTGFVFDETSGMYYDHSTGFYYDSVCWVFFTLFDQFGRWGKIQSICLFFILNSPHRSVSCTTMPTQASTTAMIQKADGISFTPGLRCLLCRALLSHPKRPMFPTRNGESSKEESRRRHIRMRGYVTTGCSASLLGNVWWLTAGFLCCLSINILRMFWVSVFKIFWLIPFVVM